MSFSWKARPEAGNRLAVRLMLGVVRFGGRSVARICLYPITLYFFLVRQAERRASRRYLSLIFGRRASVWQVLRHIHTFAATILDRVYLLSGQLHYFQIGVQGLEALQAAFGPKRQGALIFGAHLGSFDALRALARQRPDVQVRIVLDKSQNPVLTQVLTTLNPTMAAEIIDAGMDGMAVVMAIKQAAEEGACIAMLVDRPQPGNRLIPAQFGGQTALFPCEPWLIAAALNLPILLAFGIYLGRNRYELIFESFAQRVHFPQRWQDNQLPDVIGRFARRLEVYMQHSPYNWFNFYDFWDQVHHASRVLECVQSTHQQSTLRR